MRLHRGTNTRSVDEWMRGSVDTCPGMGRTVCFSSRNGDWSSPEFLEVPYTAQRPSCARLVEVALPSLWDILGVTGTGKDSLVVEFHLSLSCSLPTQYGDLDRWGMMKMKTSRFVVADAGKVVGTTALSSSAGAHGPVEEFTLLPGSAYCRAK